MKNILISIHKYLLYTFVFLLPWQTIWIVREIFYSGEKWHYGTIGIYVSDIALIAWILLSIFLYKDLIIANILQKQKLLIVAFFLSLFGFLSIMWADDKTLAFYFALKLSFAIDLFFLVQIIPLKIRTLSFVFIISAFIQNLLGLYQFVTQQTFAQKFFGLQFHDVWRGSTAIINIDGERWLRTYGAMPHPNIFGGLLLVALLLSIYLYITTKRPLIIIRVFLLMSVATFSVNIVFTFSRVIWVSTMISLTLLIICITKRYKKYLSQLYIPIITIILTTISIVGLHQSLFTTRITQDSLNVHNSINERKLYLQQAKKIILQKPLHGTGIGNYTNTVASINKSPNPIWQYQPVHNIFLYIFAEIGIVGIALFLSFLFFVLKEFFCHKRTLSIDQYFFATIFASLLFVSLFDHWTWTSHFGIILLFFIAGLSIKKGDHDS